MKYSIITISTFIALALPFYAFELNKANQFFQQVQTPAAGNTSTTSASTNKRGASISGNVDNAGVASRLADSERSNEELELEIEAESPQQDDLLYQVRPELLEGGEDVNVSFSSAQIRAVIRTFAKKAGISVVISPIVDGEVTSQLYNVPVREALQSILNVHKLYYIPEGKILQIVTEEEYRIFAKKKLIESRVYEARWSNLRKAVLAARPYLTRGLGKITINSRTSRMIISDLPQRLNRIENIMKKIEVENQQLMITARVLEITYSDQTNVGAFYRIIEQNTQQDFINARFQSVRAPISQQQGGLQISVVIDDVPFPSAAAPKSIQLGLAAVGVEGEVTVVSSPRLLVEENSRATIHIGQEIPYPTSTTTRSGIIQSSFEFIQAGTRMVIVPKVTDKKKKMINLRLDIESSTAQLISFKEDGSLQAPQKNITRTTLTVNGKSGKTLVIAGFINYVQVDDTVGIPLLKDIPFISFLFSSKAKKIERREVAILITPRIVDRRGTPVKRIYRQLSGQAEN